MFHPGHELIEHSLKILIEDKNTSLHTFAVTSQYLLMKIRPNRIHLVQCDTREHFAQTLEVKAKVFVDGVVSAVF